MYAAIASSIGNCVTTERKCGWFYAQHESTQDNHWHSETNIWFPRWMLIFNEIQVNFNECRRLSWFAQCRRYWGVNPFYYCAIHIEANGEFSCWLRCVVRFYDFAAIIKSHQFENRISIETLCRWCDSILERFLWCLVSLWRGFSGRTVKRKVIHHGYVSQRLNWREQKKIQFRRKTYVVSSFQLKIYRFRGYFNRNGAQR